MNPDFERAHAFSAAWEGGYVFHPADPGGETNLGVTKTVWQAWCQQCSLPVKPMKALTMADVLPLYEARYWKPLAATLKWPLSAAIYDMSVNHGVGDGKPFDEGGHEQGATWMLWRAYQIAPHGSPLELALAACMAREEFYRAIVRRNPTQQVFWKGWMRRVNAQREWLKANAAPLGMTEGRVLLVVPNRPGDPEEWNGKPAIYGGVGLSDAVVSQLRLLFPQPGGPWNYQTIRVFVRSNGDMVLDKTPA